MYGMEIRKYSFSQYWCSRYFFIQFYSHSLYGLENNFNLKVSILNRWIEWKLGRGTKVRKFHSVIQIDSKYFLINFTVCYSFFFRVYVKTSRIPKIYISYPRNILAKFFKKISHVLYCFAFHSYRVFKNKVENL